MDWGKHSQSTVIIQYMHEAAELHGGLGQAFAGLLPLASLSLFIKYLGYVHANSSSGTHTYFRYVRSRRSESLLWGNRVSQDSIGLVHFSCQGSKFKESKLNHPQPALTIEFKYNMHSNTNIYMDIFFNSSAASQTNFHQVLNIFHSSGSKRKKRKSAALY